MPLTYDQKSEIRMAFDEAYIPPDRRRDFRVKYRVEAQISLWADDKQGQPFTVRVEDFSPTGVGLVHTAPLEPGSEYLIKVPRPNMDELVVLLAVVRCVPQEDGTYLIGLELASVMDRTHMGQLVNALQSRDRESSGRRVRRAMLVLALLAFGVSMLI